MRTNLPPRMTKIQWVKTFLLLVKGCRRANNARFGEYLLGMIGARDGIKPDTEAAASRLYTIENDELVKMLEDTLR
jgi:hypothetical protein